MRRRLLVYACCQYSFRELGMWAVLKGISSLSERAWRKRLEQSRQWIAWLLSELSGVHQTPAWLPSGEGRMLLIDATRFKTPAGTGDDVRLHQSYDLRAGRMEQVQVTDRHQAESLARFGFRAGDLVVTDAGYAVGSSVEQTQQSKSFVLQRTAASQLHLEDEQGQTINLKERIKHVAANRLKEVVGFVCLPESGQRARVRVLCYRLPKEQASKAARLRKKHGPKYNQELVWWAGWVILVTTTNPAQWSGKELVALYRARWQIEVFFKRLKQGLRLHQLRLEDWERVSCVVQLNLIGWWLQEEEAQWMREVLTSALVPLADDLPDGSEQAEGVGEPEAGEWIRSHWTLAHFCCEQVRTMVRGAWSHRRLQECQQALQRYVRSRKRKRGHHETEQCAWLQRRCPPPASAGGA